MKEIKEQLKQISERKDFSSLSIFSGFLLKEYNKKDFIGLDLGVTPRVLNHWIDKKICGDGVELYGKYRFTFVEFVWLSIVKDLRTFNLSLDQIMKIKNQVLANIPLSTFFKQINKSEYLKAINSIEVNTPEEKELLNRLKTGELLKKYENENITHLFFMLLQVINSKHHIKLLIDSESNVLMYDDFYFSMDDIKELDKEVFISIPLVKYIERIIKDLGKIDWMSKVGILNEKELQILSTIREGKADSITIKFTNGEPKRMEVDQRKRQNVASRLSEIFYHGGYQELTVKTQAGDITYTNIKTKVNL